ncbi:MAG TPA: YceI family protein [Streptosporangiaceae bacterium]|nr:YceI family protein [Streptosporangiaceae bacterium]
MRRRWVKWAIAAGVVVVVLAVGGPFVYIHFIEGPAPAPLTLKPGTSNSPAPNSSSTAGTTASSLPGTWTTAAGSVVGYRVNEVLVGQNNVAVGRSKSVTGHLTIGGDTVTAAAFTVKMATIHSDQSQRDAQFDGRIMDVASYPTGTFTLTHPITLPPVPAIGTVKTYSATGNLRLHGHTRPVTFTLSAERTTSGIKISGSIPIKFADWSIPNPSFGSFVTTDKHGLLEFLLNFTKA